MAVFKVMNTLQLGWLKNRHTKMLLSVDFAKYVLLTTLDKCYYKHVRNREIRNIRTYSVSMYWIVHWKYLIRSQTIELFYFHQKYECDLLKAGCYLLYYVYFLDTSKWRVANTCWDTEMHSWATWNCLWGVKLLFKDFFFHFHFSSVGAKMLSSLIQKQLKLNVVAWSVLLISPGGFICKLSKENELWAHNENTVIVKAMYMLELM